MGKCIEGKSEGPPKEGFYQCLKCGVVSKKKDHLCQPDKLQSEALKKPAAREKKSPKSPDPRVRKTSILRSKSETIP